MGNIMKKGISKYDDAVSIDQRFGKWVVVDNNVIFGKRARVICQCDCGTRKTVEIPSLLTGKTIGCYCTRRGESNYAWNGFGEIPGRVFAEIKCGADKRNIKYDLSKEYLWELFLQQDKKCALSGMILSFGTMPNRRETKELKTASVDRINSKLGYIEGNVQWVHAHINIMKNAYDNDYFINLCKIITQYQND
jgi:hypothetical protein